MPLMEPGGHYTDLMMPATITSMQPISDWMMLSLITQPYVL